MREQSKVRVRLLTGGGFFETEEVAGEVFDAERTNVGGFFVKIGETDEKHSANGMLYFYAEEVEVLDNTSLLEVQP